MSDQEVVDTAPETTPDTAPAENTGGDWYSSFKEGLGENELKAIEKYQDGDSFRKGAFSAFSMIGKKGDIPAEGSAPETYGEFADKLGFIPSTDAKTYIDLDSETYGDSKAGLDEMYNGLVGNVMQKAIENFRTNPSPEAFEKALIDVAMADAEASLQSQRDGQKQLTEQFNTTAARLGLSPEQLREAEGEVTKRFGWDENTNIHEILHTLAKTTSNSTTLQDAHLNNSQEGLQTQIDALQIQLADSSVPEAQHKINLNKMMGLLERQASLLERG